MLSDMSLLNETSWLHVTVNNITDGSLLEIEALPLYNGTRVVCSFLNSNGLFLHTLPALLLIQGSLNILHFTCTIVEFEEKLCPGERVRAVSRIVCKRDKITRDYVKTRRSTPRPPICAITEAMFLSELFLVANQTLAAYSRRLDSAKCAKISCNYT